MNLVTGATGFLGSHVVCQLLQANRPVRALKRSTSSTREFEFIFSCYFPNPAEKASARGLLTWTEGDILDIPSLETAFEGIAYVYHCAAMVSFFKKDRDQLMKINGEGTANVVNLSLTHGIKKFCYVSSVAALGRKKSGENLDENSKWESGKLNSNYAISKYKAEIEVWRGAEEGLNVVMVNPGVIIGTGDFTKGSNALIHTIRKGMPLYSTGVNGYVDVRDVASALIKLGDSEISSRRFVMVSENIRIADLFNSIADGFGVKRPYIKVRPWMAAISWRLYGVMRLLGITGIAVTKETARAAMNESFYSSDRIKKELSFTFTPIEQTISECCKLYPKFIQFTI